MPISFTVDDAERLVRTVATGPITRIDIEQHLAAEFRAGGIPYAEVIDATQATAAFDTVDARSLVESLRRLASTVAFGPTAVIVSDDTTYGMVRMLEALLDDVVRVKPFRADDRAEAEAWARRVVA